MTDKTSTILPNRTDKWLSYGQYQDNRRQQVFSMFLHGKIIGVFHVRKPPNILVQLLSDSALSLSPSFPIYSVGSFVRSLFDANRSLAPPRKAFLWADERNMS